MLNILHILQIFNERSVLFQNFPVSLIIFKLVNSLILNMQI